MNINPDAFFSNSFYNDSKLDNEMGANSALEVQNALKNKEINNNIGVLQIANASISSVLNNPNITLNEALTIISNAKFFGKNIFRADFIIRDDSGVVFDGNRILSILPTDEKDLYMFKKALKREQELIMQSMKRISKEVSTKDEVALDSSYLKQNSNLFSKSHNTAALSSRIDSLLA